MQKILPIIRRVSSLDAKNIAQTIQNIGKKHMVDMVVAVFMAVVIFVVAFPSAVSADRNPLAQSPDENTVQLEVEAMQNETQSFGALPEAEGADPSWSIKVPITAYSSTVGQTDSTPFITASGTRVRDGIVAANFLPIGTQVRVPELYGDKIFVVEDRMNKRYYYKMDIWMDSTPKARQFGLQYATVEVFPARR